MTREPEHPTEPDDLSDPRHPDHDLSEWAPYELKPRDAKPWLLRRWLLILIAFLVIAGLVLPILPLH